MKLQWLGHACFYITTDKNTKILLDPFEDMHGYSLPENLDPDIVTVSHNHKDHNTTTKISSEFTLINTIGSFVEKDVEINGVQTFHDAEKGANRGLNTVYNITVDNINICHLGDLGHCLTNEKIEEIGEIDILLIPIGGIFTINIEEARTVIKQLSPKIIIPMHYKTEALAEYKFNLDTIEKFVASTHLPVEHSKTLELSGEMTDKKSKVVILDYK